MDEDTIRQKKEERKIVQIRISHSYKNFLLNVYYICYLCLYLLQAVEISSLAEKLFISTFASLAFDWKLKRDKFVLNEFFQFLDQWFDIKDVFI